MSVEHELASLKAELKDVKEQLREIKKMKQAPRQKRKPSEYALFVQQFSQKHKGHPDLMKAVAKEWAAKKGGK